MITILFGASLLATTTLSSSAMMPDDDGISKEEIIERTVSFLKERKPRSSDERIWTIANSVYEESQKYDMDYRLILALMKVESNFRNSAVSNRGARGLMQVMPSSARMISRDAGIELKGVKCLHVPETNITLAVNYLSKLQGMFDNTTSALHAYNAGPARVRKPAPGGTARSTAFTRKVLDEYRKISEILPEADEE